jgi:branched-chain amino acid transport system ATP-binding protein
MADSTTILDAAGVTKQFGGLTAVSDVTFSIPQKSIVSIIGPNGAGKTTFFNMLTGLYRPTLGRIAFEGKNITGGRPDKIQSLGMARTFQNIRPFGTMTALENVMVGQHARMRAGLFGSILRTPGVRKEERRVHEKAAEELEYVGIPKRLHDHLAINLAYGDQRRVEIARALASDPHLLLLDEPTVGLDPEQRMDFRVMLREIGADSCVLVSTHLVEDVVAACSDVVLVDAGRLVFQGVPDDLVKWGGDGAGDSPAERGYSALLRWHRERTEGTGGAA